MGSQREQRTERVIEALVRDLEPVRPVHPGSVLSACLAVEVFALASVAAFFGLRSDLWARLGDPLFLAAVSVLGLGAAWCASIAVRLSVPGHGVDVRTPWLLCVPALLAAAVLILRPPGAALPAWPGFAGECAACIGLTAAGAALPWLATLLLVRRLAPFNSPRVGLFAGLSAFFAGALATELHCPNASGPHLAFAHYLPVTLLAAATCIVAGAMVRARMRADECDQRRRLSL